MDQKPTTIKEIAQRLNVSVSTVSRALHNHPSIGLRTRMLVRQLATELHYEPNQAAISFKKGKTHTIGLLLPSLGEEFFSIAINAIEDSAAKHNYTVLIGQSHDDLQREKRIAETMRGHRVDGMLVSISKNTDNYDHFENLERHHIPVVFFDRVPPAADVYKVYCSLKKSSIEMVDWLIAQGHTAIGFIKGPGSMASTDERLQGYIQGLAKAGIRLEKSLIAETDLTREQNREAMKKLLKAQPRPTAVVAFNDYVALDAIRCTKDEGYRINGDIYFASYANLPITSYLDDPPIISVEQFPAQQAEKALGILIERIEEKDPTVEIRSKLVLESKLVVNEKLRQSISRK
jgi:LacI family transcriptional regulator, repressor for deo operon, udp, cdd, tsx, nupC, and nupG